MLPRAPVVVGLLMTLLVATAAPVAAQSAIPPTIDGPIPGLQHNEWGFDLAEVDYRQDEYFISGTADPAVWSPPIPSLVQGNGLPTEYRTRFQVVRPNDSADFNGTLFVEWVNVSAQFEVPVDFLWGHRYIFREGAAYVFASIQEVGVCANRSVVPGVELCTPMSVKGNYPDRYESLHHPGDPYAFDMYRQVVASLEANSRSLIGADPDVVIAVGESQSAISLNQWICSPFLGGIDAYLSDADVFNGIDCAAPIPTIQFWSEESARNLVTFRPNLRVWMVGGAPHVNRYANWYQAQMIYKNQGLTPTSQTMDEYDIDIGRYGEEGLEENGGTGLECLPDGNEFPRRFAIRAAMQALDTWARTGREAPIADPFEFTSDVPLANIARDEFGNAVGGVPSPVLEVPVATYVGVTCGLFGSTVPFEATRLVDLYGTHAEYVRLIQASIEAAVEAGFMLPVDGQELLERACRSPVAGGPADGQGCPTLQAASPYAPASPRVVPQPDTADAPGEGLPATGGSAAALGLVAVLAGLAVRRSSLGEERPLSP